MSYQLLEIGLANVVIATGLALVVVLLGRLFKNPHLTSVLWLVVFAKLITPPLVVLPITLPTQTNLAATSPRGPASSGLVGTIDRDAPQATDSQPGLMNASF